MWSFYAFSAGILLGCDSGRIVSRQRRADGVNTRVVSETTHLLPIHYSLHMEHGLSELRSMLNFKFGLEFQLAVPLQ